MNYSKVYALVIEKASKGSRKKGKEFYYERHHILPKCMGGGNEKENLVLLTAREHFICHWLLVRLYPENSKIVFAFWAMCNQKSRGQKRYIPSSRTYQEGRESFSYHKKLNISPLRGRKITQEHKDNISRNTLGKKKPEGFGKMISLRQLGRKLSEEQKKKISDSSKGVSKPVGHGKKIGISNTILKSKGTYKTPKGDFSAAHAAAIANKCSDTTIWSRCKNINFPEYVLKLKNIKSTIYSKQTIK